MTARAGCIYWVADALVKMPPENNRTDHPRRPVLVVSGLTGNSEEAWPIVMICPISSGPKASAHDIRLTAGFGGLTAKSWVRVTLAQPLLKSDLTDCLSPNGIPQATLQDVHAAIFSYLEPLP